MVDMRYRFDGRIIRVDKASERAPRGNTSLDGFQGRGGYNAVEGGYGGYSMLFTVIFIFVPLFLILFWFNLCSMVQVAEVDTIHPATTRAATAVATEEVVEVMEEAMAAEAAGTVDQVTVEAAMVEVDTVMAVIIDNSGGENSLCIPSAAKKP